MQTLAVFSGETENRINMSKQRKSDQESDEGDGGHLGARNTWPADSKELGSNDCISVRQIQKVTLVLFLHLHETESQRRSLSVLTLELQHHITQVCLDVEFIVRG